MKSLTIDFSEEHMSRFQDTILDEIECLVTHDNFVEEVLVKELRKKDSFIEQVIKEQLEEDKLKKLITTAVVDKLTDRILL